MSDLLDAFTQLLAYVGDEGAKDGYFLRRDPSGNPVYSIPIRAKSLADEKIADLVNQLPTFLTQDTTLAGFPDDIVKKATNLKELYNSTASVSTKQELIDYMNEFEGSVGMQGGLRKKAMRKSKSRKHRTSKSRNRKSRKYKKSSKNTI